MILQQKTFSCDVGEGRLVEPPGFEPGSKQMPDELSTCVFCY